MENVPGVVPIRIKHLHSSAVRYGEIFHSPSAHLAISHADLCNKIFILYCYKIKSLMQKVLHGWGLELTWENFDSLLPICTL